MTIKCNIELSEDLCIGCGLCVAACPRKILVINDNKLNKKGSHYVSVIDTTKCIGCGSCTMICPNSVIKLI